MFGRGALPTSEAERAEEVLRSLRISRADFAARLAAGQVTTRADFEHPRLAELDALITQAEARRAAALVAPESRASQTSAKVAGWRRAEAEQRRADLLVVARRAAAAAAQLRTAVAAVVEVARSAEAASTEAGFPVEDGRRRTGEQLAELLADPLVAALFNAGR